ncbi:transcriptional regulator, AraC family with amidase-like domain [Cupriavidus sp. YR651]|uniref:GlxA family transcriptional regulator n=1 Tax=Cupriavidus sp. YR651 TaxID=1855315 RepID=UPI0008812218|nr:GlxA family transcriptional regulator [Cupriavidus sp. YR651]SDC62390.1 transcriptional regulator, AraC family with amidase-like domain [Cupriavidus sp. YR651]
MRSSSPDRGKRTHQVWFVVFEQFQLLDVSGPLQVFATANDELQIAGHASRYETGVYSLRAGSVKSSSGVAINAQQLPRRPARGVDTVIVPGGPGVFADGRHCRQDNLIAWIRGAAPRVARMASVCTGAFVLAQSGLLDGRRAVTHWAACEQLASQFPAIDVQPDAVYAREGAYWTSAGVTAGIDMALGMVEADMARDIAMAVAKKLVVCYKRPGGQSQFSSALLEQTAEDPRIEELNGWMRKNLRRAFTVEQMAEHLGMTSRTFARFFRRQTGTTPAHALERIRLEHACRLIESGRLSIKAVSKECGFSSEEILRRSFIRHLHVSPSDYRQRFSSASP